MKSTITDSDITILDQNIQRSTTRNKQQLHCVNASTFQQNNSHALTSYNPIKQRILSPTTTTSIHITHRNTFSQQKYIPLAWPYWHRTINAFLTLNLFLHQMKKGFRIKDSFCISFKLISFIPFFHF